MLAASRAAWETVGHRGAVLDALRMCISATTAPLPDWLSRAVEDAVTWWARASTGKKGRQARYAVKRREIVRHLARAQFYRRQLGRLHQPAEALAMTAEWFRCSERTISASLARVKRLAPGDHYVASDGLGQMWSWFTKDPKKAALEIRRLGELYEQYAPRTKTR